MHNGHRDWLVCYITTQILLTVLYWRELEINVVVSLVINISYDYLVYAIKRACLSCIRAQKSFILLFYNIYYLDYSSLSVYPDFFCGRHYRK